MFKEKHNYSEESKNKLFELLDEDKDNIMYFFKILNNHRAKDNSILNKETFKFLGEAFEYIAKISFNKKDVEIFKLLFILSTTYYYKKNEEKKYLFVYIENFKEFHEKEFWENYFDNFLNYELENTLHIYGPIDEKNKKMEDIQKEKEDKLKISLFSNLLMVIQNMIDFHLDKNFINEFVSKINDKYKFNKEELEQIKAYLDENKNINDKNNINEIKLLEDKENNINNKDIMLNLGNEENNKDKDKIINIDKEENINNQEIKINNENQNVKENNLANKIIYFIDSD